MFKDSLKKIVEVVYQHIGTFLVYDNLDTVNTWCLVGFEFVNSGENFTAGECSVGL